MDDRGRNNQNLAEYNFEFHKAHITNKKILVSRAKPTPSKWDDAQKWLAGISTGRGNEHGKDKPRNSNADDRRLLNSASQRARESTSSADVGFYEDVALAISNVQHDEGETKKIDCNESLWRMSKPAAEDSPVEVKSVCLRDVGTEMTPIASQEPSRTGTPLRATTPALTSPIDSRSSSPRRCRHERGEGGNHHLERKNEVVVFNGGNANGWASRGEGNVGGCNVAASNGAIQVRVASSLESRALAWDEAERAKYMAR